MKFIKLIIVFAILITPSFSYAGSYMDDFFDVESVSVVSGLYTKHLFGQTFKDKSTNLERDYNETNDYFSIKVYLKNDYKVSFARFNNSYYEESYAIGVHKDLYEPNQYISFGAELLLTTGYKDHISWAADAIPIPSAYMRVDINRFSVKISVLSGSVLAVTGEYRFYFIR
jgi:hypothetical protein